jgi:hypothetical protein
LTGKTHYDTLGLPPDATPAEIREAYAQLTGAEERPVSAEPARDHRVIQCSDLWREKAKATKARKEAEDSGPASRTSAGPSFPRPFSRFRSFRAFVQDFARATNSPARAQKGDLAALRKAYEALADPRRRAEHDWRLGIDDLQPLDWGGALPEPCPIPLPAASRRRVSSALGWLVGLRRRCRRGLSPMG